MFSPITNNEAPHGATPLVGYLFDGLVISESYGSSDAAISLLQELARSHELGARRSHEARSHQRSYESCSRLEKVPPSEWRSLGGYFDYTHWADRDRFMELDRAIAAQRNQLFDSETDAGVF